MTEKLSRVRVGTLMRCVAVAALGSLSMALAESVELVVERDRITAGQLAQVIPAWENIEPATVLAYAPRPGAQRQIRRAELMRWGRDQGLDIESDSLPESLLVRRATRRLGLAEARDLVVQRLAASFDAGPQRVEVDLVDYRPVLLPRGELTFNLPRRNLVLNRPTSLSIEWKDADGRTGRFLLRASIKMHGSYAVARRDLRPGTELTSEDLRFEEGPLPGAPEIFAISASEVVGRELRGSLAAGRPLKRRLLVVTQTIKRGDLIEIRLRSGAVVLRTPARAEESGLVGDRIQCRNLDSGQRITARVLSPRLAEILVR